MRSDQRRVHYQLPITPSPRAGGYGCLEEITGISSLEGYGTVSLILACTKSPSRTLSPLYDPTRVHWGSTSSDSVPLTDHLTGARDSERFVQFEELHGSR